MKLLRSSPFVRSARRLLKKNPSVGAQLRSTLELLELDPFHPQLQTHKLKGKLAGSWAGEGATPLSEQLLSADSRLAPNDVDLLW